MPDELGDNLNFSYLQPSRSVLCIEGSFPTPAVNPLLPSSVMQQTRREKSPKEELLGSHFHSENQVPLELVLPYVTTALPLLDLSARQALGRF
jgi:hypothetical protein